MSNHHYNLGHSSDDSIMHYVAYANRCTCDSLHQGRKQITLQSSPPSRPQHPRCLHQQYQQQFTSMAARPVTPSSLKRRLAAPQRTPNNRTSPLSQLQVRRMGTRPQHPLHLQLRMQSTGKPGLSDTLQKMVGLGLLHWVTRTQPGII